MLIDQTSTHLAALKTEEARCRVWAMFEGLLSFLRDRGWIEDAVMDRYSSERETFQIHDDDIKQAGRPFILDNYATWSRLIEDCSTPLSPGRAYGFWIKLSEGAHDAHETTS